MGWVLAGPDGRRGVPLSESPRQISVIIPHYNDLENLGRCMVLLKEQTLPPDNFEVVVADNNSRCGIEEVKRVCGNRARVVPARSRVQERRAMRQSPRREARYSHSLTRIADQRRTGSNGVSQRWRRAEIVGGRVDIEYSDPSNPTGVEAFEMVFAFNFKRHIEKLGCLRNRRHVCSTRDL